MGVRGRGAAVGTPSDFRGHGEAALGLQTWPSAHSARPPQDSHSLMAFLLRTLHALFPFVYFKPASWPPAAAR